MKVLLITYHFPPDETVASRRLLRIANSFLKNGSNVAVHTYSPYIFRQQKKENEINNQNSINVIRSSAWIINFVYKIREGIRKRASNGKLDENTTPRKRVKSRLGSIFIPDWQLIAFVPMVLAEILRIYRHGRVDAVIASGPIFSSFLMAKAISIMNRSLFILDYRDPWSDSDYRETRGNKRTFVHKLESLIESKLISSSDLIITISKGLGDILIKKGARKVKVAYNSLSPRELAVSTPKNIPDWLQNNKFKILHSGSLYGGRRDPSPLFEACSKLDDISKSKLQLIFLGLDSNVAKELSQNYDLDGVELITESVTYDMSRFIQSKSDMLVLLNWQKANQKDYIVTAKVFEYIASQKKILSIGSSLDSEVVRIIRDSGSGEYIDNKNITNFILSSINNNNGIISSKENNLPSVEDIPSWVYLLERKK